MPIRIIGITGDVVGEIVVFEGLGKTKDLGLTLDVGEMDNRLNIAKDALGGIDAFLKVGANELHRAFGGIIDPDSDEVTVDFVPDLHRVHVDRSVFERLEAVFDMMRKESFVAQSPRVNIRK